MNSAGGGPWSPPIVSTRLYTRRYNKQSVQLYIFFLEANSAQDLLFLEPETRVSAVRPHWGYTLGHIPNSPVGGVFI